MANATTVSGARSSSRKKTSSSLQEAAMHEALQGVKGGLIYSIWDNPLFLDWANEFSVVSRHLSSPDLLCSPPQVLDQGAYGPWVLRMLGLTGLIRESVNFTDDEIHRSFVFVTQGLVRNGDEESMAAMFLVPNEIAQFDSSKGKLLNATGALT